MGGGRAKESSSCGHMLGIEHLTTTSTVSEVAAD